jgi:hypothetical protein
MLLLLWLCPLVLLQVTVQFLPLDNTLCIRQFLAHWKPQACILMVRARSYVHAADSSSSQHSPRQRGQCVRWIAVAAAAPGTGMTMQCLQQQMKWSPRSLSGCCARQL